MTKLSSILFVIAMMLSHQIVMAQSLIQISAEGRKGQDGSDGRGYNSSSGSSFGHGSDGTRGDDASTGPRGGSVVVSLKDLSGTQSKMAAFSVLGLVNGQGLNKSITYSPGVLLSINARGGPGGTGGRGGDGQGGCNGRDGRDATRSSDGTNGGDGCPGGDAGPGGRGGDGGPGGNITVRVSEDDTHLLMLVKEDIRGGDGGSQGEPGTPGRGGSGGSGGSSYSWEERTGTRPGTCTGGGTEMVSNGDGSYSPKSIPRTCAPDEPIYTTYKNSGGSRGQDGRNGSVLPGQGSNGNNGANGTFTIEVANSAGSISRYSEVYSLKLEDYDLVDANQNGVFEPGEIVSVQNIRIRNTGGMPTPQGKTKVLVFLQGSDWLLADPIELTVPQLSQGQSTQLNNHLKFKIKNTDILGTDGRAEARSTVLPKAALTRIDYEFGEFSLPRTVTITYPVEITPLSAQKSISAGQTVALSWRIKNKSRKSFGGESELRRKMMVSLVDSSAEKGKSQKFVFKDSKNLFSTASNRTGNYARELTGLGPGEEMILDGKMTFSEDVMPYSTVTAETGLTIQTIDGLIKPIQVNQFHFRVASVYKFNPKADILLVTNSKTEEPEFNAWVSLIETLGLKADVWDVTFNGFFDLARDLKEGKTLQANYAGKTIVVLNNDHEQNENQDISFLSKTQFLNAAVEKNINFVFVGSRRGASADLLRTLAFKSTNIEKDLSAISGLGSRIFTSLSVQRELLKQAAKRQRELNQTQGSKSFAVLPFSQVNDTLTVTETKYKSVSVFETLSPNSGTAAAVEADSIHDPLFIKGEYNLRAFLHGLALKTKLNILLTAKELSQDTVRLLIDNMIQELVLDIDQAESKSTVSPKLIDTFKVLSQSTLTAHSANRLGLLFAPIQLYLETFRGGIIIGRNLNMRNQYKSFTDGIKKFRTSSLDQELVRLEDKFKFRKSRLVGLPKRENMRRMLIRPSQFRIVTTQQLTDPSFIEGGLR